MQAEIDDTPPTPREVLILPDPPDDRQKSHITDGEQRELDFEQEDAETGESPITDDNDSMSMTHRLKNYTWWIPKGVGEEIPSLWVPIRAGKTKVTQEDYWGGIHSKIEMLIEEVAEDPVGMTGLETPREAVQWLVRKTVGDATNQDIWIEGKNPGEWAWEVIDYIEAGAGQAPYLIYQATSREVTYKKVTTKQSKEWGEELESESLWIFLENLMLI